MRPPLSKERRFCGDIRLSKTINSFHPRLIFPSCLALTTVWAVSDEAAENVTFTTWDGKPRSIYYTGAEKWAKVKDPADSAEAKTKLLIEGVDRLDVATKTIYLASGKTVNYGKLLIATGGTPKSLDGVQASGNVTTFRSVGDFKRLRASVKKNGPKDVIVVGGGFLGSELTMAMAKNAASVTQVFPEEVSFQRKTDEATYFGSLADINHLLFFLFL